MGGFDGTDEVTAVGQPAKVLESLLEMLACPLDNSILLSAVHNAAGKVVALRSRDVFVPRLSRPAGLSGGFAAQSEVNHAS